MRRFCKNESRAAEEMATEILRRVREAIENSHLLSSSLTAVVLGGGYGRGEGGVLRTDDGRELLYNDLDLFVFIPVSLNFTTREQCRQALKEIERQLSAEFEVEVEFGPLTPVEVLPELSATLMYQELIRGWVPVWGNCSCVERILKLDWSQVPRDEFRRLLLNRGAGLLMARQKLNKNSLSSEDRDFIIRNINKAFLASGDVFLYFQGAYCFGGEARLERLKQAVDLPAGLREYFCEALAAKYSPGKVPADLSEYWKKCTDCWLAADRYQAAYPADPISRKPVRLLKNILLNVRYFKRGSLMDFLRHPRVRLLPLLAGLLEHPDHVSEEESFLRLWKRFN